jgi:hypothetical protein
MEYVGGVGTGHYMFFEFIGGVAGTCHGMFLRMVVVVNPRAMSLRIW